ncbi:HPP family protein [Pseudobdellovibrio exovorus]|nr:CBS domain-containing protein [Pseudobdellovibrio exovorus]
MSSNLVSISEERDIDTAESLMKVNRIRHLPVVNQNNELSGILSAKDVVKVKDKKQAIKSVMTAPVKVVRKDSNIKSVIELMLRNKISSILVADSEDIVGIVTTDDLLRLLTQVLTDSDDLENTDIGSFFDESWKSYN